VPPRGPIVILLALATIVATAACGSDDGEHPPTFSESYMPPSDAGAREGSSPSDGCATPGTAGCPCDMRGAYVECGKIVVKSGDYTTCSMGHSWCDGKTWGACIGDRFVNGTSPLGGSAIGGN
jgi:hypothetical protein